MLEQQVWINGSPPYNVKDLKDLLMIASFQISQHTFRHLVLSMPQWVRAVLEAEVVPSQYLVDVHNVIAIVRYI